MQSTPESTQVRLNVPTQARSYQLHGLTRVAKQSFAFDDILDAADNASQIAYETSPIPTGTKKRLLSHTKIRYMADDLSGPLSHGTIESRALPYDSDSMAMTDALKSSVFGSLTGAPTNTELQDEGKYILANSAWWVRTGHPTYTASKFYAVTAVDDPWGNTYSTTYDSHSLLVVSSSNPLSETVTAAHDYRVLAPWQITDANGNRTQVAFDVLGFVVKSAIMGKVGDSDGDTLSDPTTTFEYDLFEWADTGKPCWTKTRTRETHQDSQTRWLEQRNYFSGSGAVIMTKVQARPGLAPERDQNGELVFVNDELQYEDTSPSVRWVGNGRVIQDNKGNVVKAYEPYYSSIPDYEDEDELVAQGVTAINHYDPLGRLIRTDFPNGTYSKVEFTPWKQTTHDQNDTVTDSDWYDDRINYAGSDDGLLAEKRAAQLAEDHDGTPTVVHLDVLGRAFLSIAHNKDLSENDEYYETKSVLDIQGNVLGVIDARGIQSDPIYYAEERVFGMLGQSLKVISNDAGDRHHLLNALGQPMRSWDSRNQRFSHTYDTLRRHVDRTVSVSGGNEILLGRIVYGDLLSSPEDTNHVGRVYRVYDGAGVATTVEFDFKGNAIEEERQLVDDETTQPDWTDLLTETTIAEMATAAASLLDSETFSATTEHDALNRVLTAISPDDSEVIYTYDEGGALQKVEVKHRGSSTAQTVVGDITYNARGQRESVVYGTTSSPATITTYTYDPQTYRLASLTTVRDSDDAELQELYYHYDPVGNVTDIRDESQQTVYFQNSVVEAANSYTYDAVYRLIEATGREHSTQGTAQRTHDQISVGPQPMTSDPSAMRTYTQKYTYDEVGNILKMQHIPGTGTGWTRYYAYDNDGNRLDSTSIPADDPEGPYSDSYSYDNHGNMTAMPHLSSMVWNHDDELQEVTVGSETVYFQYAGGQRSRKYVEKTGSTTEERIYLGPFEIYRKRVNGTLDLERESLHISDGSGRICIIETKTVEDEDPVGSPTGMWRYQLSNHLGSAAVEVDDTGAVISYEEYHPYGTSAYRAVDASVDVSAKRYRYTGMERDEETSLEYHSARYYAPWLGRWTAPDSTALSDGLNRYRYARNSPTSMSDPNGNKPPPRLYVRGRPGNRAAVINKSIPPDPSEGIDPALKDSVSIPAGATIEEIYQANLNATTEERYNAAKQKIAAIEQRRAAEQESSAGGAFYPDAATGFDPSMSLDDSIEAYKVPTTDGDIVEIYGILTDAKLQAEIDAIVLTLNVEKSDRYNDRGGESYACNCYGADFLGFRSAGAYIPVVWWTDDGLDALKRGTGASEMTSAIHYKYLGGNGINQWLRTEGADYGWVPVDGNNLDQAQDLANAGYVVVGSGQGINGDPGHLVNVAPEDKDNNIKAKRDPTTGQIVPNGIVRTQAGGAYVSRGVDLDATDVLDSSHQNGGYWYYDPNRDRSRGTKPFHVRE